MKVDKELALAAIVLLGTIAEVVRDIVVAVKSNHR